MSNLKPHPPEPGDNTPLRQGAGATAAPGQGVEVWCLCAEWCGTCRAFRALFDDAAHALPGVGMRWLELEAWEDTLGDLDITTFPMLLIRRAGEPVFAGPLLPHRQHLDRLLAAALAGDLRLQAADAHTWREVFKRLPTLPPPASA